MDIDKISFRPRLLDIVVAVSEAHFVSFDLELSGVPVKQPGDASAGRPSLQQRYIETKKAAEQYQILQIGLTCVREDEHRGAYVCKPYNFNLNPVVEERIDIDRTFAFHSGAVEFLLSVGFQMDLPFTWGVGYLSRKEAQLAKERAAARQTRTFDDMQINPEDKESLELLRKVRAEIERWKVTNKPNADYLNIGPLVVASGTEAPVSNELSRFEKRLVHQVVRAEYPDLVTISKHGFIQIVNFNQEREDFIQQRRRRETRERIIRQTGFRWVIEAMCGGDLHQIDPKSFAVDPQTGEAVFVDLNDYKARFTRAQARLKDKPRVVVGHNCFLDLVYIYRTFVGDLPDTVEEFADLIHEIFPVVVDTKYMATHNCGDINPASSLEQIADQLNKQENPLLETHKDHGKYQGVTAFHEAGYDSFLTAQVAVRLSAKLESEGSYIEIDTPGDEEVGGVKLDGAAPGSGTSSTPAVASTLTSAINGVKGLLLAPVKALTGDGQTGGKRDADSEHASTQQSATETDTCQTTMSNDGKKKKKKAKANSMLQPALAPAPAPATKAPTNRFAHATAFDQLADAPVEDETVDAEEVLDFDNLPSSSAPTSTKVVSDTDGVSAPDTWGQAQEWVPGRLMPRFGTDFWSVYGNKLRVFGTKEGVLLLDRDGA